jgi:hypothetical protein
VRVKILLPTVLLLLTAFYASADQIPEDELPGGSSATGWMVVGTIFLVILALAGGYYYHHHSDSESQNGSLPPL